MLTLSLALSATLHAQDSASTQVVVLTPEQAIAQADCELHAPMNFQVLRCNVELGTLVASSTTGFTMGDTRRGEGCLWQIGHCP